VAGGAVVGNIILIVSITTRYEEYPVYDNKPSGSIKHLAILD
jgi:hypothetical protein